MVAPYQDGRVSRSMVRVPGSGAEGDPNPVCLNLGIVSNLAAMIPVPQTLMVAGREGQKRLNFNESSATSTTPITPETRKLVDCVPQGVLLCDSENSSVPVTNGSSFGIVLPTDPNGLNITQVTSGVVPPVSPSSSSMTSSGNARAATSSGGPTAVKRQLSGESFQESTAKRPRISPGSPTSNTGYAGNGRVPYVMVPIPSDSQNCPRNVSSVQGTRAGNINPVIGTQGGIRVNGPFMVVPLQQVLPQGFQQLMADRNRLKRENEALKHRLARFHQLMRNKERLRTVLQRMSVASA